jgi:hypothetical protein
MLAAEMSVARELFVLRLRAVDLSKAWSASLSMVLDEWPIATMSGDDVEGLEKL